MTAPNNPPLRDCSTGTTDQLEHLLRHLKKAKQAHSQAVHGIRKELKEAYKQKNPHSIAELRRQLQETLADTNGIARLQAEYETYRRTVPSDQLRAFDYKHRAFWKRWYFWVAVIVWYFWAALIVVGVSSAVIGGTGNEISTNSR